MILFIIIVIVLSTSSQFLFAQQTLPPNVSPPAEQPMRFLPDAPGMPPALSTEMPSPDPIFQSLLDEYDKAPFTDEGPLSLKVILQPDIIYSDSKIKKRFHISVNKKLSTFTLSLVNKKTGQKSEYPLSIARGVWNEVIPPRKVFEPWTETLRPATTYDYFIKAVEQATGEVSTVQGSFSTPPFHEGFILMKASASKNPVPRGESFELSWNVENADECSIFGLDNKWDATEIPVKGVRMISVADDEKYSLSYSFSCSNFTSTVTAFMVIPVITDPSAPTPIVSLSASDTDIEDGQSSTLSWNAKKYEECNTFVDYFSEENGWEYAIELPWTEGIFHNKLPQKKGRMVVSPPKTARYTLECHNKQNIVHKGVTIIVDGVEPSSEDPYTNYIGKTTIRTSSTDPEAPTPRITLKANPAILQEGEQTTFSWDVDAADKCGLFSWRVPGDPLKNQAPPGVRKISRKDFSAINRFIDQINELDANPIPTFDKTNGGRDMVLTIRERLKKYLGIDENIDYDVRATDSIQKESIGINGEIVVRPKTTTFYQVWCGSGYKSVSKTLAVVVEKNEKQSPPTRKPKKRK